MTKIITKYKFKKLATESIINALRLHFDSILLFKNDSFPTAFHISVLAMEEIAKSNWIEHYYDASVTNQGFPDTDFEQKWLKLLYNHKRKQYSFLAREFFNYSPKFVEFIKSGELEIKKQNSIYVGLKRTSKQIETKGRISLPTSSVKRKDAKQLISLNNTVLIEQCERNIRHGNYYGIEEKQNILNDQLLKYLKEDWEYKTGLKSDKWFDEWRKGNS
ncbi:AbiV family abortive infection protein [Aureibaculum marinum]|uniref:AbiV family abortive infection protein n=1 Tax=Aureibaculum marinum TaxID=2487930 RepID=A0A3N4N4Z4_9FLAO|nr:AbiV family abortive infection protein [Aureibaculum marinum]RPD91191.1 AbiV family abortive infection protein [Aureibaculum marinum]